MIVLIMGRTAAKRTAVATTLSETLGWEHVHVADDFGGGTSNRLDVLKARMAGSLEAGRAVIYSGPSLSPAECRTLREALRRVEIVRLLDAGDAQPPMTAALTLDGQMSPGVLAATVRAVLRLDDVTAAKGR